MNQGNNSFVEKRGNRLYKSINLYGNYGPFEECKLLKYVSKLGPEFPQHVKCEGLYQLSYDYIDGITLEQYMDYYSINPKKNQINILIQLLKINLKLYQVGLYLCDQGVNNYILDDDGIIHVIDFGYVENPYRQQLSLLQETTETIYEYEDIEYNPIENNCLRNGLYGWYRNGLIDQDLLDTSLLYMDNIENLINIIKMES